MRKWIPAALIICRSVTGVAVLLFAYSYRVWKADTHRRSAF